MPRRPSFAETEQAIGDLAELFGWRHHQGRFQGLTRVGYADGFPADVLLRGHRLLFVTIAGAHGALTPPERRWLDEIASVTSVETLVIQRDDLHPLTRALRPTDDGQPLVAGDDSRAPPFGSRRSDNNSVRPSQRNGRQKPHQASTQQEEACEGPTSS